MNQFSGLCSAQKEIQDLCANPTISAADRMVNGTVRLYRGGYYWDLNGMPDRKGHISEAKKIMIPFLAPVSSKNNLMSCLVCNRKAYLYKFEKGNYWSWMPNGRPFLTTAKGKPFKPSTQTFDAVFHNGKTEEPLMIALKGKKVYYFSTKGYEIGLSTEYGAEGHEGGKNGENFPVGINAAFSWPPLNSEEGYYVFLFKGEKYCRRKEKLTTGQECDEWRDNKELFGCTK